MIASLILSAAGTAGLLASSADKAKESEQGISSAEKSSLWQSVTHGPKAMMKTLQKMSGKAAGMAGVNLSVAGLLQQSQIFTGVVGSFMQLIGAFLDVTFAPFMPFIFKAFKILAKGLPVWGKLIEDIVKFLVDSFGWLFANVKWKEDEEEEKKKRQVVSPADFPRIPFPDIAKKKGVLIDETMSWVKFGVAADPELHRAMQAYQIGGISQPGYTPERQAAAAAVALAAANSAGENNRTGMLGGGAAGLGGTGNLKYDSVLDRHTDQANRSGDGHTAVMNTVDGATRGGFTGFR